MGAPADTTLTTEREITAWFGQHACCPDCGASITTFRGGPRGGLCQNALCVECRSEYNLAVDMEAGVVWFAQRIGQPRHGRTSFYGLG